MVIFHSYVTGYQRVIHYNPNNPIINGLYHLDPIIHYTTGWWFQPTSLKNDGVKVSWNDFPFPTEWKVIKVMFQTTNQLLFILVFLVLLVHNGSTDVP